MVSHAHCRCLSRDDVTSLSQHQSLFLKHNTPTHTISIIIYSAGIVVEWENSRSDILQLFFDLQYKLDWATREVTEYRKYVISRLEIGKNESGQSGRVSNPTEFSVSSQFSHPYSNAQLDLAFHPPWDGKISISFHAV